MTGPGVRALVAAARPRQWVKNLSLLAGIVFAAELDDPGRLVRAVTIVVAYCLVSSASYLLNDVKDAERDRQHPLKRQRPVASGRLAPRTALRAACVLASLGVATGFAVGPASGSLLLVFGGVQLAYSLGGKHVPGLDVLAIAGLFVLRAVAGAVAVDVRISPWLVGCSGLLALFLALAKRRAELASAVAGGANGRPALRAYSVVGLDLALAGVAFLSLALYLAYTLTARETHVLVLTVPFVAFGLGRYVQLVRGRGAGEEPDRIILQDAPILATVAGWVALCATLVATAGS